MKKKRREKKKKKREEPGNSRRRIKGGGRRRRREIGGLRGVRKGLFVNLSLLGINLNNKLYIHLSRFTVNYS